MLVASLSGHASALKAGAQVIPRVDGPLRGVYWAAPSELESAVSDLYRMAGTGVEAIRAPAITGSALLVVADSLGLVLFQDIGLRNEPARRLLQNQTDIERTVNELAVRQRAFRSAAYYGLGVGLDTSDPRTCGVLRRLTDIVHAASPTARTYYVTHFLDDDRCRESVDLVMSDAFLSPHLVAAVARGDAATFSGTGVGALRKGVVTGARTGLAVGGSREAQARFLEQSLGVLLRQSRAQVPVVFVYEWRDGRRESIVSDAFGLMNAFGVERPAFDVVRGFYTGEQTVFAFASGVPSGDRTTWFAILCWGIIAVIASAWAASPTFRQMTARYYFGHGFYREAVVEGRDVLPVVNIVLLATISFMAGVVIGVGVLSVARTHTAYVLADWLPNPARALLAVLVDRPLLLVCLVACVQAFWCTVWTSLLSLVSRAGKTLLPAQTLILTIWPLWPFVIVGLVAAVAPSIDGSGRLRFAVVLLVGGLLIWVASSIRTMIDFRATAHAQISLTLLLALLSPAGVLLMGLAAWMTRAWPELVFVAHLLTRG